jgi:chemosensory pili system protein ChpB (putative protein-glutamate methylesterase)
MHKTSQAALRVAILAEACVRDQLRILLEDEGVQVVLEEGFELPLPDGWNGAEVILASLGDRLDKSRVQSVLRQSPVPVLFSEGGIGRSQIWHRRLMGKLQTLANRAANHIAINPPVLQVSLPSLVVLGASIGGPEAVRRFLQALPDSLPVTFLLAQHISGDFQGLLVEQLDRCSTWAVAALRDDQTVAPGQVWVVPAESRIEMSVDGVIRRCGRAWDSAYHPDIDTVLAIAAETFGAHCGAIMFSGLGKDGTKGCESVIRHGGFVWAQSSGSCVISNMPEAARRLCKVELSGTPEELARALAARCQATSATIN